MNEPAAPVTIDLRIPGKWSDPRDLVESLATDIRLTPETLVLPDGTTVEFGAVNADSQFAQIFRSSCRQPATPEELATVDSYSANVLLSGPGGSLEAARKMMRAAASILRAGGAGVFIDNCALAHGGQNWLAMTDDGGSDALTFAFVAIVRGKSEVWTMGMHVLGLRDIVMKRSDAEGGFDIIDVIRYLAASEDPVDDGHVIADQEGPRFRAVAQQPGTEFPADSPMHNPFGRLKLVSIRDITEAN